MENLNPTDDSDSVDFTNESLKSLQESRRTYLLTYSKAYMKRFADFETFSKCILEGFASGKSSSEIVQWGYLFRKS